MEKISQNPHWPEIVFGSSDSAVSQAIQRAVKAGELKKLAPRLYTSNLVADPAKIVERNLYHILGTFFTGALISHRSALEGGATKEGLITLTYRYTKNWSLPGFTIKLIKGEGPQEEDRPFIQGLFFASRERALLENLQPGRGKKEHSKILKKEFIEHELDKVCRINGVEELNRIRDKARALAPKLQLEKEFKTLDKMIGALLTTQNADVLQTEVGIARAKGIPYDDKRLELLAKLAATLKAATLPIRRAPVLTEIGIRNLAFFEAYFSNYIEGTKFEVNEASDIIFRGTKSNRPEDAHDVLGTFQIVADLNEMRHIPRSYEELIILLKKRHGLLMSSRKDKKPGEFKNKANMAGNTLFVHPDLVTGTLIKAFDLYQTVEVGIKRAIFMMFMIAEVHPFLDGNGRIARIMMNSELVYADEIRIIIPTVYREDYILALRRLSRDWDPEPYLRMSQRAHAFTASINFLNYEDCLEQFKNCNAFLEPYEGKLKF